MKKLFTLFLLLTGIFTLKAQSHSASDFNVGDTVTSVYQGTLYTGVILAKIDNTSCTVKWNNGKTNTSQYQYISKKTSSNNPTLANSQQSAPLDNFVLQNKSVHYIKVYTYPKDSASTLLQLLYKQLNSTANIINVQITGNTLTGQISQTLTSSTAQALAGVQKVVQQATFFIEFKDGKYRVDVHSIILHIVGTTNIDETFEEEVTKKHYTAWKNNAAKTLAPKDEEYTKYFTLSTSTQKSDW